MCHNLLSKLQIFHHEIHYNAITNIPVDPLDDPERDLKLEGKNAHICLCTCDLHSCCICVQFPVKQRFCALTGRGHKTCAYPSLPWRAHLRGKTCTTMAGWRLKDVTFLPYVGPSGQKSEIRATYPKVLMKPLTEPSAYRDTMSPMWRKLDLCSDIFTDLCVCPDYPFKGER